MDANEMRIFLVIPGSFRLLANPKTFAFIRVHLRPKHSRARSWARHAKRHWRLLLIGLDGNKHPSFYIFLRDLGVLAFAGRLGSEIPLASLRPGVFALSF